MNLVPASKFLRVHSSRRFPCLFAVAMMAAALAAAENPAPVDQEVEALRAQVNGLYGEKKFAEALAPGEQLLEVRKRKLGPEHLDVARTLNFLGSVHENLKQYPEAEKLYREALAMREKLAGADSPLVAESCTALGWMLKDSKRGEAEILLRRTLEIREKAPGSRPEEIVWALRNLGEVIYLGGEYGRAEGLLERALAMWRQLEHSDRADLRRIATKLDAAQFNLQHWRQRVELSRRMAEEEEALTAPNAAEAGEWWWRCAVSMRFLQQYAEAVPVFEKSLAHFEPALGKESYPVSTVLLDLGYTLIALERFPEARPCFERAAAIRQKLDSDLKTVGAISEAKFYAAWCDFKLGSFEEAEARLRDAAALDEKAGNLTYCRKCWDQLLTVLDTARIDARKAEAMEKLLSLEERISGATSDPTLRRVETLAAWLESRGDGAKAHPLRARWAAARPPWAPPLHLIEWTGTSGDLEAKGLFGFPQSEARMLEDAPDFRVSAWSNEEWLVFQSLWRDDGDDTVVEAPDGREKCDTSFVVLDLGGDGKLTPDVDRFYMLNLDPLRPGVNGMDTVTETTFKVFSETGARGAIRYVRVERGAIWRIDTIAIPLAELKTGAGAVPRVLFHATSSRPALSRCCA